MALRRLRSIFGGRVRSAHVDLFVRAHVLAMTAYLFHLLVHGGDWLSAESFHYNATAFSQYVGFPAASQVTLVAACAFVVCAAAAMWPRSRLLTAGLLALALYMDLIDDAASFTLTRLFVINSALLFAREPAGLLPGESEAREAIWPVRLLQLTPIALYFASGACKCGMGDWLGSPYILRNQLQVGYETAVSRWLVRSAADPLWIALWGATLTFELGAPILFIWSKTRNAALATGVIFHILIAILMKNLIYFSLAVLSYYVLLAIPWTPQREIVHRAEQA